MTATVPDPAVVTAVKERVSPSISVSLAMTSLLVSAASSATVNTSATATGAFTFTRLYTLTWPELVPLPSFPYAPIATVVPSEDKEIE